jgi:hypothetical protein
LAATLVALAWVAAGVRAVAAAGAVVAGLALTLEGVDVLRTWAWTGWAGSAAAGRLAAGWGVAA